jgi:RNA polymerase sigma factor (sigma-70 family)
LFLVTTSIFKLFFVFYLKMVEIINSEEDALEAYQEFVDSSRFQRERKIRGFGILAHSFRQGDENAFSELYEESDEYRRRVALCTKTHNPDLPLEDLDAEVLIALYRTADEFDVSRRRSFATFFRAKVRGQVSRLRSWKDGQTLKYKNTRSLGSSDSSERSLPENRDLEDYEIARSRMDVIAQGFSETETKVFYFKYGLGMRNSYIATELGVSTRRVTLVLKDLDPRLAQRIQEDEIPFNASMFTQAVRDWYEQNFSPNVTGPSYESPDLGPSPVIQVQKKGSLVYVNKRVVGCDQTPFLNTSEILDLRRAILETHGKVNDPARELEKRGLSRLLARNNGLGVLSRELTPSIADEIPQVHKWQDNDSSVNLALQRIAKVYYTIPNYARAEFLGDREGQIDALTNFLENKKDITGYFEEKGLGPLMESFYDPKGIYGLDKLKCIASVFRFYNRYLGFEWFNRDLGVWIPRFLFGERGLLKSDIANDVGEEAIAYCLYQYPGLRTAEATGDRQGMLRALDTHLISNPEEMKRFTRRLRGVARHLINPPTAYGALKFYSGFNGLELEDPNQPCGYLQGGGRKLLKVVFHDPFENFSPKEIKILYLKHVRGMSLNEIGDVVGLSRRHVRRVYSSISQDLMPASLEYDDLIERTRNEYEKTSQSAAA